MTTTYPISSTTTRPKPLASVIISTLALLGACAAPMLWFTSQCEALEMWLSIVCCGAVATLSAGVLKTLLRSDDGLVETAAITFALSGFVGCLVMWDNYTSTGLYYSPNFDDSFYYFNARRIADGGPDAATHWTLFELLLAAYCLVLEPLKTIQPYDLLPVNWLLASINAVLLVELTRAVTGRSLPRRWLFAATLGVYQYLAVIPYLYRDMLVTVGFVGTVLFAWRGPRWAAVPFALVLFGTRGGHGVLAVLVGGAVVFTGTELYRRNPRTWAFVAAVFVGGALLAGSSLSAGFLSGRQGDEGSGDVATMTMERQRSWNQDYAQSNSSLGARVLGLGPVGWPLRMFSGYFAPVVMRDPVFDRSMNSLFLPASMGDVVHFRAFSTFTLAEWFGIVMWPVTAPVYLLGMRRLARGSTRHRTLMWGLAAAFLMVMIVSMQERHRAPLVAFNSLFAAAALQSPWTFQERYFVRMTRVITTGALLVLNVVARFILAS